MVALVRARTGIHEGEHSGYQKRALMMGHGERSGKDCARLAVFALAVAEEQGVAGGIGMSETAGLADEAAAQHGAVGHGRVAADDEVFADDILTYNDRRLFLALDGTV